MAKASPFDPALVRELASLLAETDLTEIEVEKGDLRIRVARRIEPVSVQVAAAPPLLAPQPPPAAATPEAEPARSHPGAVPSPMVGTVYVRPSPEAKAFVDVGARVEVCRPAALVHLGEQRVEDPHLVALGQQGVDDRAADEPGAAGDQDLHVRHASVGL